MARGIEDRIAASAIRKVAVRVAPVNYLVALLLFSFISAFLIYLEADLWAYLLLGSVWLIVPFLALTDRIVSDGTRIRRTGLVPRLWARLTATRDRIKFSDVEMVLTNVARTIRRGSDLIYTYRTAFYGKGKVFVVHSNRGTYLPFIDSLLPKLKEEILDRRSIELRDHFAERSDVRERARSAKIPSADVLEDSFARRNADTAGSAVDDPDSAVRARMLHGLANELRINGLMPQSVEAFRRAVRLMPRDAGLLFDFALCLKTYAVANRNARVDRRARAMMRLAERRAGDDADLLSRIGEGYYQFGDWGRSYAVFRRVADRAGEHFRTLIGLAEVSLHEGKIAHVIHNFNAASESAASPALRRWTRQELEYFSRLNDDEEYMELEISRMNLIETLESAKRSALRISLVGFPAIVFGILFEDRLVADIGWAVSLISLAVWAAVILGINVLSTRIPYDTLDR